jgi:hypothetical protein
MFIVDRMIVLTGCKKHVIMHADCPRHHHTKAKPWEDIGIVCLHTRTNIKLTWFRPFEVDKSSAMSSELFKPGQAHVSCHCTPLDQMGFQLQTLLDPVSSLLVQIYC